MIFRRTPPVNIGRRLSQYAPQASYRCDRCEVSGVGDRCWMCGTRDVVPVTQLWLGTARGPRVAPSH